MKTHLIVTACLMLLHSASARTWTSADGSKTFEAELRSYNEATKTVTVITDNGRAMTFTTDKISAEDVAFLKEEAMKEAAGTPAEQAAETVVGAQVTKERLHRLDGKRFRRAELDKAPEYYILYYSASW